MYELLVAGLYRVQAKMKNGRHLSGRQKNSPQDAVGMLIGDILQGL